MPGTVSEEADYNERRRVCDLGYLRHLFKKDDGSVGYRCPAESPAAAVAEAASLSSALASRKLPPWTASAAI